MFGKKSSSSSVYQLAYQFSYSEENRNKLVLAGISRKMINMIKCIRLNDSIDKSIAALIVNMTLHPLCAEEIIQSETTCDIIKIIKGSNDDYLKHIFLKVLRNLTEWSKELQLKIHHALLLNDSSALEGHVKHIRQYFPKAKPYYDDHPIKTAIYRELNFWHNHINSILQSTIACENDELLIEWIGILSNTTNNDVSSEIQWHDLIHNNSYEIRRLCHRILDSSQDDVKMELIIWLGELCVSQECSIWIARCNLVEVLREELQSSLSNWHEEMMLQILLTYHQFLIYEETRFQITNDHGEFL
jgi:hypothetical protein